MFEFVIRHSDFRRYWVIRHRFCKLGCTIAARREVIHMARMKGIETEEATWFTRLLYWFIQRGVGKITGKKLLVEPVKITAHHPRLLKAYGQMEMGQAAANSVPITLKSLASIKAATLVGCPF
jgi:hypothetical protein